ncbi:MAG: D-alanine--D-alanine ligase [Chloroflexi bacterium]|nr:D-alanine--D-alanine ligase [Chloroflexota bacterium]
MRVAVLFGGKSGEHEVSLLSAKSVMDALDKTRYEVAPVGISRAGRWLTAGDPYARLAAGEDASCSGGGAPERGELVPGSSTERFPRVDVVFPVLHGPLGEDGTVQGLMELAGLPYVGSGVLGSALGMDKVAMKDVFAARGLPIAPYLAIMRKQWQAHPALVIRQLETKLSYPMFVKPANLGSSVGVSKAHNQAELITAMQLAACYDRKLVVEAGIDAREIECAVLGNDEPSASVCGEVIPNREFYDYQAKYLDDASELIIPADIPAKTAEHVRELAIKSFIALDCAGMARADFLLDKHSGEVYLNELNTIPGFTSISMYPKLWEASGLPYAALLDRLVELALERFQDKQASETTYIVNR